MSGRLAASVVPSGSLGAASEKRHASHGQYRDTTNYTSVGATDFLTVTGGRGTWDTGTVTLSVNGNTISTAGYGQGSTASSVAQALASALPNSLVRVTAIDDDLYIEAMQGGSGTNYPFTLSATNTNHATFPTPSFVPSPISGNLYGGVDSQAVSQPKVVYSYLIPKDGVPWDQGYDGVGNLMHYKDSVTGAWDIVNSSGSGYDTLNRLSFAKQTLDSDTSHPLYYCWSYDAFGNRTAQTTSSQPFTNAVGT